ncbi:MAG: hypothetical protein IKF07_02580 [Eubacterium sp.]|nr:hypothetical protein [Eubacterium sp.]
MKIYFKTISLITSVLLLVILAGCDQGVKTEDLTEVLKTKNIDEIVEFIDSYKEQKNKAELDEIVVKDFESIAESTEYDDFLYMENFVKEVKDEDLKNSLQRVIDDNITNKVIAFTSGKWVRRDYTNLDGAVAEIKWNDKKGTAILTGVSKTIKNDSHFQKGDVKWKNIEALSEEELVYEDLSKSTDYADYYQAYATLDYSKGQLLCKVSAEKSEYANGNTQVWVKKEFIDAEKEVVKRSDFEKDENKRSSLYCSSIKQKKKGDRNIRLRKAIKMRAKRKGVIDKMGYGHILFQANKDDPIFKYISTIQNAECQTFVNDIKKSKYAVIYTGDDDRFIKMYFNSKDRLIAVVKGYDYDGFAKRVG